MSKSLLLTCPVEELGGYSWIGLDLEDLGDELRSNAAELVEISNDLWTPAFVFTEGVADVTSNGGEGLSNGEVFLGLGFCGEGGLGRIWIPFVELEFCRGFWGDWGFGVRV